MALPAELAKLVVVGTRDAIYAKLLDLASAIGLDTETWEAGDPTRTLLDATARLAETWESLTSQAIEGGFLTLATGDWLTSLLRYNYAVERREATYAECTVRLTNGSAATIGLLDVDDVTASNPTTGATYRNITSGTLAAGPGAILDLTFRAEVAGSDSSSAVSTITQLVTAIPGVTCSNTTAAVGADTETDEEARARGQAKLESISAGGPKGAYHYAITTPSLQADGITAVTRTRVIPNSTIGTVTIYVAGPAGAVLPADVTKAQAAVETYAEPHCVTATVSNAVNLTQNITYTLWVYSTIAKTTAQIQTAVQDHLIAALAAKAIGGDVIPPATSGYLYKGWVEAEILKAVDPHGFRCTVSVPSADVPLSISNVVVAGTVTGTINLVAP